MARSTVNNECISASHYYITSMAVDARVGPSRAFEAREKVLSFQHGTIPFLERGQSTAFWKKGLAISSNPVAARGRRGGGGRVGRRHRQRSAAGSRSRPPAPHVLRLRAGSNEPVELLVGGSDQGGRLQRHTSRAVWLYRIAEVTDWFIAFPAAGVSPAASSTA